MNFNLNLNFNRRERLFVIAAVAFVALFLISQVIVKPVFEKKDELQYKLAVKQNMLSQMRTLHAEYISLKKKAAASQQQFDSRAPGFTLFSFMDSTAGSIGIKQNMTYMKPSSTVDEATHLKISSVELKLQDITLKDLTAYLYQVETSPNMIKVKRLSITKDGIDQGLITVVMQVETVET